MNPSERPVIVLGHGVRLAGAADLVPAVMDLGIPVLTSWPAADLVDSDHPMYFGRPGVYGQRCANHVLANADLIVAIGCRLSIWTVGYNFPLPHQHVMMVDVDAAEARKFHNAEWLNHDARDYIHTLQTAVLWEHLREKLVAGWVRTCETWRTLHPWLESPHHDHGAFINPHRFMAELQPYLRPDEVIVADCATGSLAAHQMLKLKPPMRLMTSGGLGEMGCGLPAAVGASFARDNGRVICLTNDGGIMLTLGELATVAHHHLPVKIIVFCNQGYGMIRDTQRGLGYQHVGVDRRDLSFPNFVKLARSFGIDAFHAHNSDALKTLSLFEGLPVLMTVNIDPEYRWAPKLRAGKNPDGSIKHAQFDRMEP